MSQKGENPALVEFCIIMKEYNNNKETDTKYVKWWEVLWIGFYWWTSNIKFPLIFLIVFPSSKLYLVLHAYLLSRFSRVRLFATLCVDCSLPGSSIKGILQARKLQWVAIPLLQGIFPTQGLNPSLLCLLFR